MKVCPYNAKHVHPAAEHQFHLVHCADRNIIDREIIYGRKIIMSNLSLSFALCRLVMLQCVEMLVLYRIVSPAVISKFSIYRHQLFDISSRQIFSWFPEVVKFSLKLLSKLSLNFSS